VKLTPHQLFVAAIGGFCVVMVVGMVGSLFWLF
jgi:uncharacterized OsmC-like protein